MPKRIRRRVLLVLIPIGILVVGTTVLVWSGLQDQLEKADVALVLGSKVEPDGTPSPRLRARLDKTVELYRAGYFPSVIASGGVGKEGFDEARVMRDYLVAQGIPSERIIVDSEGVTTFASARKAAEIVRDRRLGSVFVVSQHFHIPRTRLALQKFGVPTVYTAHADFFEPRDIYSSVREAVGYVSYCFRRYDLWSIGIHACEPFHSNGTPNVDEISLRSTLTAVATVHRHECLCSGFCCHNSRHCTPGWTPPPEL